jgi:hypothetical protein
MAHCCRFLLPKHKEDKTHKKTTKKNQEKGGSLPSNFQCALSFLPSHFCTSILNAFSWHLLLFKQKKRKEIQRKEKLEGRKKMQRRR